jgi:hypothetical protein
MGNGRTKSTLAFASIAWRPVWRGRTSPLKSLAFESRKSGLRLLEACVAWLRPVLDGAPPSIPASVFLRSVGGCDVASEITSAAGCRVFIANTDAREQ